MRVGVPMALVGFTPSATRRKAPASHAIPHVQTRLRIRDIEPTTEEAQLDANVEVKPGSLNAGQALQSSIFSIRFGTIALAFVVAFGLTNLVFLPLVAILVDSSNPMLGSLLAPFNNMMIRYLVMDLCLLSVPVLFVAVLASPALTSFVANAKFPVASTWRMAMLSGIVFFFFHTILLIILIVFRNSTITPTTANYPFPRPAIDALAVLGLLAGVVMSCSVTIFGWLGARMKRKLA